MRRRLVVVGGGITGLAAAHTALGVRWEVTVIEASDRWGGLIRTSEFLGRPIDEGADAFLARVPEAVGLCEELGLADRLTQPAATRAMVLHGGELRWFPAGSVLGVPLDTEDLADTGLLSDGGLAGVLAETTAAGDPPERDVSVGGFLRARFGDELVDHVVGPLVGGINAGDVDEMSLRAVTPQLADAADAGGSLTTELRRRAAADAGGTEGPVFHGLLDGTGALVEHLVASLLDRGGDLRTGRAAERLEVHHDGVQVHTAQGPVAGDAVVLTTPAAAAAALVEPTSPAASLELSAIRTTSVVLVTLAFRRTDLPALPDASGFLVPRDAGLLLTAASWGSNKWAHWDDGDHMVLRVSAGHRHDQRAPAMSDDEVVTALVADLRTTMGVRGEPVATRVSRWDDGFHRYDVGHLDRVDRIDAALHRDTGGRVVVAGAAYRGLGIPACIRQAGMAVRSLAG